jgi:DGQHR domain-containing protein
MKTYNGQLIQQNSATAPRIFAFSAPASEVLEWAGIKRTLDQAGGAQRLFSESHAKSIKNFFLDGRNVIPTAVILALPKGAYSIEKYDVVDAPLSPGTSFATLTIRTTGKENVGTVIDGQHRLLALKDKAAPLLFSVLLGVDETEEALQFVVINNKAKRVPADLVRAIIAEMSASSKTKFEERVGRIRLSLGNYHTAIKILFTDGDSPFYGIIDWDLNRQGNRIVKPLAIETALRRIILDLRVPELELDEALMTFSALWHGVKLAYQNVEGVWGGAPSKLLSKAVIVALTEYFIARINLKLEEGFDPADTDAVTSYAKSTIGGIPSDFWLTNWERKSLDSSSGRELIMQAISRMKRAESMGEDAMIAADWFLSANNE